MLKSWRETWFANKFDFSNPKEAMVKNFFLILCIFLSVALTGCETVHKAGETAGAVVGKGANTLGSVTEGGAEAIQGKTTPEENPYNR